MQAVDEAVVISTPDIAAVTDAMKTIEMLGKFKKKVLGLVVNRYRNEKYELTPDEISSTINHNVIGVVPEDSKIPDAIAKGLPAVMLYPHSKASISFKKIAASLINEHYETDGLLKRFKGLFESLSFRKESQPEHNSQQSQVLQKEVSDVAELKAGLADDIKEELKREIMKKVTEKLRGRMHES